MLRLSTPTLLVKPEVAKRNIGRMADKARRGGVRFRPHFKTHQSAGVGEWFRATGVEAITVSSVNMGRYFAEHGWRDITVAFPANWHQIGVMNELAAQLKLNLLVESVETIQFLAQHLTARVNLWLKLDTGYHRTGIAWDDVTSLLEVAQAAAQAKLPLVGMLTHSGHSYRQQGKAAVLEVYQETVDHLSAARQSLAEQGFTDLEISLGDTPTCSLADDVSGVDEIRPGNFVFYDVMQGNIGSCAPEDIAVGVACPVVARHPERGTVIVHGGTVHLSADFVMINGARCYGWVARLTDEGWGELLPNAFVQGLAQEHGVIHLEADQMAQTQIGDWLVVLPAHSCLTVALHRCYYTPTGETLPIMPLP